MIPTRNSPVNSPENKNNPDVHTLPNIQYRFIHSFRTIESCDVRHTSLGVLNCLLIVITALYGLFYRCLYWAQCNSIMLSLSFILWLRFLRYWTYTLSLTYSLYIITIFMCKISSSICETLRGAKVGMLTHTYPHKPLRKIKVIHTQSPG